jgi:hypothetical protein
MGENWRKSPKIGKIGENRLKLAKLAKIFLRTKNIFIVSKVSVEPERGSDPVSCSEGRRRLLRQGHSPRKPET